MKTYVYVSYNTAVNKIFEQFNGYHRYVIGGNMLQRYFMHICHLSFTKIYE
jgi:hypothetical protein